MLWKNLKKLIMVFMDLCILISTYHVAIYLSVHEDLGGYLQGFYNAVFVIAVIYVVIFYLMDLYDKIWRYAGLDEVIQIFGACVAATFLIFGLAVAVRDELPLDVHILAGMFTFFGTLGYRFVPRLWFSYRERIPGRKRSGRERRVLVMGAGQAGAMLVREMRQNPDQGLVPVGFLDDDFQKVGKIIGGLKVLGPREEIPHWVEGLDVSVVILAINRLTVDARRDVLEICRSCGVELRILPSLIGMIGETVSLEQIRKVDLEDLLGRDPVVLDTEGIEGYIRGRSILVTGGAGSIGRQLCRDILAFSPRELVVLDSWESGIFEVEHELRRLCPEVRLSFVIASIRDYQKLKLVFEEFRPEVVFHAAALKHVPLMEANPAEAVKTNILGTRNVALLSDAFGVKRFVQISTDKAVNPTNVMGATKRVCELYLQALNGRSRTEFIAVRFGNVLGSAGSVVPFFQEQIRRGGPVTVTHREITRFFMTIPEASKLVIQAAALANGGELFVLDMGEPVRIYDLATDLIWLSGLTPEKDVRIEITGLRPGEKLYEEIIKDEEGLLRTTSEKIFVSRADCRDFDFLSEGIDGFVPLLEREVREEIVGQLERLVPSYKRFVDPSGLEDTLRIRRSVDSGLVYQESPLPGRVD